jgi:DNA-binding IclR family transcriptional regulator
MHRIWDEFDEMPGTSLTLPQASRLFGVPIEVCDRILISLVKDGRLRRTQDGRFRLYSFVA